jgi:hypothetical protein
MFCSDESSNCSWLSPLFLALQVNNGLKELSINGIEVIDENRTAMKLARQPTESLQLSSIKSVDNDMSMWREAFLFYQYALKTLYGNRSILCDLITYATYIALKRRTKNAPLTPDNSLVT